MRLLGFEVMRLLGFEVLVCKVLRIVPPLGEVRRGPFLSFEVRGGRFEVVNVVVWHSPSGCMFSTMCCVVLSESSFSCGGASGAVTGLNTDRRRGCMSMMPFHLPKLLIPWL